MGDFNFVTAREDRWCLDTGQYTGNIDTQESKEFDDSLWAPGGFQELRQPHYTHTSGRAKSKLDRIYSNRFLCDQPDRDYACYDLPSNPLSHHRAVACSRHIPGHSANKNMHIPERIAKHLDFGSRVITENFDLLRCDDRPEKAFRRMILIKQAMHTVHQGMSTEQKEKKEAGSEDRVGWILGFIRAVEKQICPE